MFDRASLIALSLAAATCLTTLGCADGSNRYHELRTRDQAMLFLTSVAKYGKSGDWRLAADASAPAARAWAERAAISDLGARIRREGGDWGCVLTEAAVRSSRFGNFTVGDRESQGHEASGLGAAPAQIRAFYSDILKLSFGDLLRVTIAACPGAHFEFG